MFVDSTAVDTILRIAILPPIAVIWLVVLIRIVGLRSLSKMTSFDFVVTIGVGSLLANAAQASTWSDYLQAIGALSAVFATQVAIAALRDRSSTAAGAIENQPLLLMRDGQILKGALDQTRMTESDLLAKLREANVLDLSEVRAAVLETTGDVSVLHGSQTPSERLIENIRRIDPPDAGRQTARAS